MSMIIFHTDLHHDGDMPARYDGDVSILGKNWGLPMLRAVISIIKAEGAVGCSGGDEGTFRRNTVTEKMSEEDFFHAERRAFTESAIVVRDEMHYKGIDMARTIGNHDDTYNADKLLFTRVSHIFHQTAVPDTDLIIMQPEITKTGRGPKFAYNPDEVIAVIENAQNPNLVISSHWAFDRAGFPGQGYVYEDNTRPIREYLRTRLRKRSLNSVLTMHGHSHRFRFSAPADGFSIITMPSIVQNDVGLKEFPCGLYMSVSLDQTGVLKPTFHRIRLSDTEGKEYHTSEVDYNYMMRYQRQPKPPTARKLRNS